MIKKYSYGHLMILEISSDQRKRPAGLIKRETGVNPVRSRHCNRELRSINTTESVCTDLGRGFGAKILSQETCLFLVKEILADDEKS